MIRDILGRVCGGQDLSSDQMAAVIHSILDGHWHDHQIALLLTALRTKGETVDEVVGAAQALRQHMCPIRTTRTNVLDTCGTGGDGLSTFNISTAAALVAAASGLSVAKHGNRAMSSKSGSADVLAALGVHVEANIEQVEACLDQLGIAFCYAPLVHPSMKRVALVRRQIAAPTIFNLLGPLCNPARAAYQLLGVGQPRLRPLLAAAVQRLGTRHTLVVSGRDGLDEISLSGATDVSEVTGQASRDFCWTPSDFGLAPQPIAPLVVDGAEASARIIRSVLAGEPGAARDVVLMNAAAAVWTVEPQQPLAVCVQRAAAAIDSGQARQLLESLIRLSHS